MKGLFRTDKQGVGRGRHYHVGYLNQDTGLGAMSEANHHVHRMAWHPEVPPTPPGEASIDPNTGMQIPGSLGTPGSPAYWEVETVNGHTHALEDVIIEKEETKLAGEEATKLVSEVIDDHKACKEYERDSIDRGREAYGFYHGRGQWTDEQREKLKSEDRACITNNKIKPQINTLLSYQIEQRKDPKFRPQEAGDQRIGELADIAAKHFLYRTKFHRSETRAFRDAAVAGRGILGLDFDTLNSIRGDIRVRCLRWDETFYGPHDEEDASDARVAINTRWYSKDAVKAEWPKRAKDVQEDWDNLQVASKGSNYSDDEYNHPGKSLSLGTDLINISKKQIKVIERFKIEIKEQVAVSVSSDQFVENITNWEEADIEALKGIKGVKIIRKKIGQTRRTVVAGTTLLADESPANIPPIEGRRDYIPQVVIYCYKDGDDFDGQVENAKDPQREINKRHSQAIDILNRMDGYGEYYDDSTFVDESDRKKYQANRAKPGFLQRLQSIERRPARVEGVKFPSELVQMMEFEDGQIQSAMNIVAQPYGANESGAALLQKQKLKVAGQEFLFENARDARARLMKMLLAFIQEHVSADQLYRIVKNSDPRTKIGGKPASEYSLDEIKELLNGKDLTTCDLVIDEEQWTPTTRMANAIIMAELAKNGQIPPEIPIEMNDTIPRSVKDVAIQMIQQQREAAAKEQEATRNVELQKTAMAQQSRASAPQEQPQPQPQMPPPQAMEGMPMQMPMQMQAPMQQLPMLPPPMPIPPQPVNIDVNVNINDRGKRLITLGPIGEGGAQSGTVEPVDPMGDMPMEQLTPIVDELNEATL